MYKNGDVYTGEWMGNLRLNGILKDKNNKVIEEGFWVDDICISSKKIDLQKDKNFKEIIAVYEKILSQVGKGNSKLEEIIKNEIDKYNKLLLENLANSFSFGHSAQTNILDDEFESNKNHDNSQSNNEEDDFA
jgi:hypothetical protein